MSKRKELKTKKGPSKIKKGLGLDLCDYREKTYGKRPNRHSNPSGKRK